MKKNTDSNSPATERIKTVCIGELLEYEFYIPDYQRGYRWTATEVMELLNDLKEYQETHTKDSPPYYLQPLVVKKRKEKGSKGEQKYEVIDGQQRLTTIGLILHYISQKDPVVKLMKILEEEFRKPSSESIPDAVKHAAKDVPSPATVNITYETRDTEKETKNTEEGRLTYIIDKDDAESLDEYHIKTVYGAIQDWFVVHSEQEQNILRTLTEHTAVIWYEPDGDAHELFQRLNIGRIPLTNAELIRALFLTSKSTDIYGEREQVLIAEQWNDIERRFADDHFWYFLTNEDPKTYDTRIDLLFETITGMKRTDRYALYLKLETIVDEGRKGKTLYEIWNEKVIAPFQTLLRFYEDPELYNNVGYIIAAKKFGDTTNLNLYSLWQKWAEPETSAKNFISSYTKKRILKLIGIEATEKLNHDKLRGHLKSIKFDVNKLIAHNVLLLHNILSTGNIPSTGKGLGFNFCDYKKERWSLEHIYPQNPPQEQESQNNFDINKLGNLALLSKEDNSSVSNAPFLAKKNIIIDKINKGNFVPLCTQRVFLRYYTLETQQSEASQLDKWNDSDYNKYQENIIGTLSDFFGVGDITSSTSDEQ